MQKLSDFTFRVEKRKGGVNKILSSAITILVIGLLVFVGPVNALQLSISGLRTDTPYIAGETINFSGTFEIEQNDIPEIKNVSVVING